MEWQPIETAPKDGTPVLIYGGLFVRSASRSAAKREGDEGYPFVGTGVAIYWNKWIDDRFPWAGYRIDGARDENIQTNHEPTHWMPLPTPPGE